MRTQVNHLSSVGQAVRIEPSPRSLPEAFFVALIVAVGLRAFSFGTTGLDWDESFYVVVAQVWLHGGVPYADVWDIQLDGCSGAVCFGRLDRRRRAAVNAWLLALLGRGIAASGCGFSSTDIRGSGRPEFWPLYFIWLTCHGRKVSRLTPRFLIISRSRQRVSFSRGRWSRHRTGCGLLRFSALRCCWGSDYN